MAADGGLRCRIRRCPVGGAGSPQVQVCACSIEGVGAPNVGVGGRDGYATGVGLGLGVAGLTNRTGGIR